MKLVNVLNVFFMLAYGLSAVLQLNDPDPFVWVALYTLALAMCVAFRGNQLKAWQATTLCVVSAAWALYLLPQFVGQVSLQDIAESMAMRSNAVEEAREAGGLLIIAIWSGVLRYVVASRPAGRSSQ